MGFKKNKQPKNKQPKPLGLPTIMVYLIQWTTTLEQAYWRSP